MKIVTFRMKNGETPKRVVHFPLERDTFRNKTLEIVEDFASEAKFLHFFIFFSFFYFSHFFMFVVGTMLCFLEPNNDGQ